MQPDAPAPAAPLLLDIAGLAALCGVSAKTVGRWDREHLLPAASPLRNRKFWARAEIEKWIAARMPDRRRWETMLRAERFEPRRHVGGRA